MKLFGGMYFCGSFTSPVWNDDLVLSTVLEVDKGDFTNNSISGEESANVREQKEKGNPGMFKLNMMAPKDWALWF